VHGELNSRLAARLGRIRSDRGLSQEGLGEVAGIHRTYIGQIERGLGNPSLDVVQKIADALEITTDRLLCSDNFDG
jgi:transcriptional regulator with XRE-family HTH domain